MKANLSRRTRVLILLAVVLALGVSLEAAVRKGLVEGDKAASPNATTEVRSNESIRSEAAPAVLAETDDYDVRPGYLGPYFKQENGSGHLTVLANTLVQTGGQAWGVQGMIRNETQGVIRKPRLTAKLFDAAHRNVATLEAWLPLNGLRPGEPAPFVVSSSLPAASVASVEWAVTYTAGLRISSDNLLSATSSLNAGRSFEFETFWERPYGYEDRLVGYPQDDPIEGPFPFLLAGSLRNIGSESIAGARVLGAWLNADGGVVHVDWLILLPAHDLQRATSTTLAAGAPVDFFYSNSNPEIAPLLKDARLVLWGVVGE